MGFGGCSSQGQVSTAIALHRKCLKKKKITILPPLLWHTHTQNNPGSPWQPAPWLSLAPEEGRSLPSHRPRHWLVLVLAKASAEMGSGTRQASSPSLLLQK